MDCVSVQYTLPKVPVHKFKKNLHSWRVPFFEACEIQKQIAKQVIVENGVETVRSVAGVDVGFEKHRDIAHAAVAVLRYPTLELQEYATAQGPSSFPYVPGLLSFREIPIILKALEKLKQQPDVILCDGQGIAHPRRLGIASHLGVITGWPTIGVAKKCLIGTYESVPDRKGEWVPLAEGDDVIGAVLRTRKGVRPLYVSVGHKVSLEVAIAYVMRCVTRFRLPEAIRWAHRLASGTADSIWEA